MGRTVTLNCADGASISAWRAEPAGRPRGGLVVCQEIFGVNQHIRDVADRFAAAGYLAIAPSLFDRTHPGTELGYMPNDISLGMETMKAARRAETMLDILAAIGAAAGGKVGITGFCWGGTLSYLAACHLPGLAAAVGYYGGGIANELRAKPKIPLMLHFGEQDSGIPMASVAKIRDANPGVQVFTYPTAGHAFNRDGNAAYDEPSATLATQLTLAFLEQTVG